VPVVPAAPVVVSPPMLPPLPVPGCPVSGDPPSWDPAVPVAPPVWVPAVPVAPPGGSPVCVGSDPEPPQPSHGKRARARTRREPRLTTVAMPENYGSRRAGGRTHGRACAANPC